MKDTIERDLETVSDWLCFRKLTLNVEKSCYMVITKGDDWPGLVITFQSQPRQRSYCIKYLGHYIDSRFNWKLHILLLCKKSHQQ